MFSLACVIYFISCCNLVELKVTVAKLKKKSSLPTLLSRRLTIGKAKQTRADLIYCKLDVMEILSELTFPETEAKVISRQRTSNKGVKSLNGCFQS